MGEKTSQPPERNRVTVTLLNSRGISKDDTLEKPRNNLSRMWVSMCDIIAEITQPGPCACPSGPKFRTGQSSASNVHDTPGQSSGLVRAPPPMWLCPRGTRWDVTALKWVTEYFHATARGSTHSDEVKVRFGGIRHKLRRRVGKRASVDKPALVVDG